MHLTAKAVITVFTIGIYQANRYILILHFYECVSHSFDILHFTFQKSVNYFSGKSKHVNILYIKYNLVIEIAGTRKKGRSEWNDLFVINRLETCTTSFYFPANL